MLIGLALIMIYRAIANVNLDISFIISLMSVSVIFGVIQLPIQYKIGVERGRYVTMAMAFLPVILLVVLYQAKIFSFDMISPALIQNLPYIMLAALAVIVPLSYFLSLSFFKKNIQNQ